MEHWSGWFGGLAVGWSVFASSFCAVRETRPPLHDVRMHQQHQDGRVGCLRQMVIGAATTETVCPQMYESPNVESQNQFIQEPNNQNNATKSQIVLEKYGCWDCWVATWISGLLLKLQIADASSLVWLDTKQRTHPSYRVLNVVDGFNISSVFPGGS